MQFPDRRFGEYLREAPQEVYIDVSLSCAMGLIAVATMGAIELPTRGCSLMGPGRVRAHELMSVASAILAAADKVAGGALSNVGEPSK